MDIPALNRPDFGIEAETHAVHTLGMRLEEWYPSEDRALTKAEIFKLEVCNVEGKVPLIERSTLLEDIYLRVYGIISDENAHHDLSRHIVNKDESLSTLDPMQKYLSIWKRYGLHEFYNSFNEFMSLTRPEMNRVIGLLPGVLEESKRAEELKLKEFSNSFDK